MTFKLSFLPKALFYAASVIYPGLVFYFLVIRKTPVRLLSLFVMAFALLAFILGTSKKKQNLFPFCGVSSSSLA